MLIESLRLFQFRNLRDGTYRFVPGVTCIVGENGQGKTNLVEAISLLSLTRSFRTSSLSDLVSWGTDACSVFASCIVGNEKQEFGVAVEAGTRKTFIDGKETDSIASLVGKLLCVSFSPTDIALVKGSPQGRRRFLDRHVVDFNPMLVRPYLDYQRALQSKQILLKKGNIDRHALESWNGILIPAATSIINGRLVLLAALESKLTPISERLFNDRHAITLRLRGNSGALVREHNGEKVTAEEVAELFTAARDKEILQQRTAVGPHRDDLAIHLFGKDARAFASQGQSRGIVLALKLAVIELLEELRSDSPIVLLDDVDSELDKVRRAAIFGSIFEHQRQIFITATEFRLPLELHSQVSEVLTVASGALVSESTAEEPKSLP